MKNPIATIEMENGNKMKVELYPDIAPMKVFFLKESCHKSLPD